MKGSGHLKSALVRRTAPLINWLYRLRLWLTRPLTLGVRLILVRQGRVLLVRHTYQKGWALPGGGVNKGETVEQAARREAMEEVGARLNGLRLQGVYTNFYEHKSDHVVVFACENFELAHPPVDRFEIDCFEFFPLEDLPQDLMSGHRRRIVEYHELRAPAVGMW